MLAKENKIIVNSIPEARNIERDVIQFISQETRNVLLNVGIENLKYMEEIRLRAGRPLMVHNQKGSWFVRPDGSLRKVDKNSFIVGQKDVIRTLELISENSIYAYQEEIRRGYITLKGGHRVGISGKTVLEDGSVKNIKDISGLNIRVSREVPGCSIEAIKYIINGKNSIYNTLLISPPQCGKTTMLRDMARVLSNGFPEVGVSGLRVGIVDERSEIAACFKGVPQNDVGVQSDVLDGCPKSIGMTMMVRSMSPQVIITDEIGGCGDKEAVISVLNAGIKILTSAHGFNISELKSRQEVLRLINEKAFERFVVLSNYNGPGTLEEVIDGISMKVIFKRGQGKCLSL
jgi:stage III sporulation protein AA